MISYMHIGMLCRSIILANPAKCAFYKPLPPNQDWEGDTGEGPYSRHMEPEQLNKAKEVAFNVKEGLGLEYSIPTYTH